MAELVQAPSDVLSKKAGEVKKIDGKVKRLIGEMQKTLSAVTDIIGVGLAAPQVGSSLRLFIMQPNREKKAHVFINPEILWRDETTNRKKQKGKKALEGCLSLKDIWGTVRRSSSVRVEYLDELGKKHIKTFKGFAATIVQHEMDHLDGILFPRRVLEQKGTLYQSHKNKKGEDIFKEIELP